METPKEEDLHFTPNNGIMMMVKVNVDTEAMQDITDSRQW
jgi:hypothetical protein